MKCGREPGGREEYMQGPCPAATFRQFDGIYGGTNAGRSCWLAAQTDHGKDIRKDCRHCNFFKYVIEAEFSDYDPLSILNKR